MIFALILWFIGHVSRVLWETNLPAFHLYVWVEFCFLIQIYQKGLARFAPRTLFLGIMAAFTLLFVVNGVWINGFSNMPSLTLTVETLTLIGMTFLYFVKIFQEMRIVQLERQFMFWFSAGNLLFFSMNSLLYIFSSFVNQQATEVALQIWGIRAALLIFIYLMYTIALLCKETDPDSPISS